MLLLVSEQMFLRFWGTWGVSLLRLYVIVCYGV